MTKTEGLRVGFQIPNGSIALLAEQNDFRKTGDAGIVGKVLAYLPGNPVDPFCVWTYVIDEEQDGKVRCFWGDYCRDLPTAMKFYEERSY